MLNNTKWTDFDDVEELLRIKNRQQANIAFVVPTLNEAATIADTLKVFLDGLWSQGSATLVDSLLVVDGGSTDDTVEIVQSMGVPVCDVRSSSLCSPYSSGKGLALWYSLFQIQDSTHHFFVDADIIGFSRRFITGMVGALLHNPYCGFVKSYYSRPFHVNDKDVLPNEGGRVTELLVRPILSRFFADAAHLVQPLAGEYGFCRDKLETLRFYSSYGVETSLLLDYVVQYGIDSVVQVDMGERHHRNRSLVELGVMSSVILQVIADVLRDRGYLLCSGEDVYLPSANLQDGEFVSVLQSCLPRIRDVLP